MKRTWPIKSSKYLTKYPAELLKNWKGKSCYHFVCMCVCVFIQENHRIKGYPRSPEISRDHTHSNSFFPVLPLELEWPQSSVHWSGLSLTHRCASLMHYISKWCTITTVNIIPSCTILGAFNLFTTIQEHILLKIRYRTMHMFTPLDPPKQCVRDPCRSNLQSAQ